MLLLFLSIAALPPVAVEVTGMEPQLAIVRREAAERGWRIGCEGRAGEEGVLRVHFPPGTPEQAIRSFSDPNRHIGSSHLFFHAGDVIPAGCDHQPVTSSGDMPVRVLGFGPREAVAGLATIARACGFSGAFARPGREDDLPAGAAAFHPDSFALDAGEDAGRRYGPMICFIQMQHRARAAGVAGAE